MRERYDLQLKQLREDIIYMGGLCEEAIAISMNSLLKDDASEFEHSQQLESKINEYERRIENQCIRIVMMQQPVASDLRFISAAMRLISDLERIGDQAFDICDIVKHMKKSNLTEVLPFKTFTKQIIQMVTNAVDSYVKQDIYSAKAVIDADDIADDLFLAISNGITDYIQKNRTIDGAEIVDLLMIAKYLERIGDHAENVAEWVIFGITGEYPDKIIHND